LARGCDNGASVRALFQHDSCCDSTVTSLENMLAVCSCLVMVEYKINSLDATSYVTTSVPDRVSQLGNLFWVIPLDLKELM
jgi:hypothetical protein